jgi:malonyl-CoA/methylmalonyl-CoA synthetase
VFHRRDHRDALRLCFPVTYNDLLDASSRVATALLAGREDLQEERVAFLVTPGFPWVVAQWGIWRAGGVAVPLPLNSQRPELEYLIDDTGASTLVFDTQAAPLVSQLPRPVACARLPYDSLPLSQPSRPLPEISSERRAMILYTSGTTSRPKGVVTTHANITAQIKSLVEAWEWSATIASCCVCRCTTCTESSTWLLCAVVGRNLPDAAALRRECRVGLHRRRQHSVHGGADGLRKLIAAWDAASPERRAELSAGVRPVAPDGVWLSGAAGEHAARWKEISGHTLLERYGMTEIGMALSNPLRGERVPGSVGTPLPGVEVRLSERTASRFPGTPGEIEVRGPACFAEYWGQPDATRDAFRDGWFRTGDTAVVENGVYRILGRTNIDILKTGGHKVSALEIEEALRQHPAVAECAVVGVPDPEWGERVAAAVVLNDGDALDLHSLRTWARELLAAHKLPSRLLVLDALPRNAMGKVMKPALAALFQTGAAKSTLPLGSTA